MDVEKKKKEIIENLDKISKKVSDLSLFIESSELENNGYDKLDEIQCHIQDAISELTDFFI